LTPGPITWVGPPGAATLDPVRWLHSRSRIEFDDESIGVLATPGPDLDKLAADIRSRYVFLDDLDEHDRRLLSCVRGDRSAVIAAIHALPGGRFANITLW
jgi:hypothetical protein